MCLSNAVAKFAQRVEALEGKYETMRLATLEWGKALDRHDRWIDEHLKRIMALEAAANDRQHGEAAERAAAPAPADSLVERVADAIAAEPFLSSPTPVRKARAAIREVAAWLDECYPADEVPEAAAVVRILRNQAEL